MICPWCIDYDAWRTPEKESTFLPGMRCSVCKRTFPQNDDEWKRAFSGMNERRWVSFGYAMGNAQGIPDRVYVGFSGPESPQGIVREDVKGLFKKKRLLTMLPADEQLRLFKHVCSQQPAHMYDITSAPTADSTL